MMAFVRAISIWAPRKWVIAGTALVLGSAVTLQSCERDQPAAVDVYASSSELTQIIQDSGFPPPAPEPHYDVTSRAWDSGDPAGETLPGGETWSCIEEIYDVADAPDDYAVFDPNAENFGAPGGLILGEIRSPSPMSLAVKRGAGTVCIASITGAATPCCSFDETTVSNVLECANRIIGSQPRDFAAVSSVRHEYFESEAELQFRLKANASFLGLFGAKTGFSVDTSKKRTYFVVTVDQRFYTLIFQPPASPANFFDESVSAEELRRHGVGPGNPIVWVSSVTYGRRAYFILESTEDKATVEESVNASFLFGGYDESAKHVSQLKGLKVYALFIGGTAAQAIDAVRGGIQSLDQFLAAWRNAPISSAAPLTYQLRSISGDYPVVKNGYATSFSRRTCDLVEGPGVSASIPFKVVGNKALYPIDVPSIPGARTITFVNGLSYYTREHDYMFRIDPYTYRVTTDAGDGSSYLEGSVNIWTLPDVVQVDRSLIRLEGESDSYTLLVGHRSGMKSLTLIELMSYWTNHDDDLQFSCKYYPQARMIPERIVAHMGAGRPGSEVVFRVTTLYWPEDMPVTTRRKYISVSPPDQTSLKTGCVGRVLATPVVYQTQQGENSTSYEDFLRWNIDVHTCSVSLRAERNTTAPSLTSVGAYVWELSFR